jgi:hypothetical protein
MPAQLGSIGASGVATMDSSPGAEGDAAARAGASGTEGETTAGTGAPVGGDAALGAGAINGDGDSTAGAGATTAGDAMGAGDAGAAGNDGAVGGGGASSGMGGPTCAKAAAVASWSNAMSAALHVRGARLFRQLRIGDHPFDALGWRGNVPDHEEARAADDDNHQPSEQDEHEFYHLSACSRRSFPAPAG